MFLFFHLVISELFFLPHCQKFHQEDCVLISTAELWNVLIPLPMKTHYGMIGDVVELWSGRGCQQVERDIPNIPLPMFSSTSWEIPWYSQVRSDV